MTGTPAAIVVIIFVLGMVGFVVWLVLKRKADVAGLRTEVEQHGWSLVERDDALVEGYVSLPFGRGHAQHARDVIRGDSPTFVAFTYLWRTGSGDSKNSHTRQVTMLAAGPVLPRTEVEPQTIVARAETAAAGGDLDVELADFNRAWSVRSEDTRVSHALLHPRMVERIMQPDLFGRGIFFENGRVAIVDHVVQVPHLAEHTAATLVILQELADLIPPHLARDYA
jgi:hypothetical protein